MFRVFRFPLLAPEVKAAAAGGAAAGGKAPTKRKKKWIDRRRHTPSHNGREVFSVYDQPACPLCHVRFRFKDDFVAHKQSDLHKARERWAETERWWATVGEQAHAKRAGEDEQAMLSVLAQRSAASGLAAEALELRMRRARVHLGPKHDAGLDDTPAGKPEIVEPRDQRWPSSPKW